MIQARTESVYLIQSNKEKCRTLFLKQNLTEDEMIDFYVSLHLVMEVSLNALFRNLSLMQIQKSVNKLEIAKDIDNINFINKATLFIYNYHYDFKGRTDEADKYHKVIEYLKAFSGVRNKLLHGHSISTLYENQENQQDSETRKLLQQNAIENQINLFKKIFEGLSFYVDHVDSSITESGKNSFKEEYLDDSFLEK
jgi:hypothetical protein